jgi:hypothetical protein
MRGEDAVIQKQVHRGPRDDGRELLQEFDGLEEEVRRAIAPHRLELDEDASIGAEAEAVLGERGAEEIATELLEAGAIVWWDPDVGVEVEAVELGLTRAAGGDVTEVEILTVNAPLLLCHSRIKCATPAECLRRSREVDHLRSAGVTQARNGLRKVD